MIQRLAVTGVTGWVGRVAWNCMPGRLPPVLVGRVSQSSGMSMPPIVGLDELPGIVAGHPSRIVHAAFPTQDQVDEMGEARYTDAVARLRASMLEVIHAGAPVEFVYLSSGAAASLERGLDLADRTRAYGRAKLDDEAAYRGAIASTGGRLCIVRAFALSGPYMTKPATYALGDMILQAFAHGAIEVRATRPVRRSYMAIDDMLRIATHAVGEIGPGESITFETAGEVVEVGELAERVLRVLGCDPAAVARPALDPLAPADDYLGDPVAVGRLAAAAGVTPAGLDEQIAVTAAWLRDEAGL